MGMSVAVGDCPMVERRGRLPYQSQRTPGNAPHPLPHNLTNIKSRHGTKTPPISSAVRAPLSLPCNFLHLSLSLVPVEGFWHVGSSSTVIDWHWLAHIGSSHVMLLTATPHMPLGRSPYIGTGRQLKLRFVCRTQRQPRTKDCLLPLIYAKWGRTEFNYNFLGHGQSNCGCLEILGRQN